MNKMKVKVWEYLEVGKPNVGYLGLGEHLGFVPMSEVITLEEFKKKKEKFVKNVLKNLGLPCEGILFEQTFQKFMDVENLERLTPKIRLDSGKVVYGFQVWWATVCPKCESDKLRQITPDEQEREDPEEFLEFGFVSIIECKKCGYREYDN